MGFPLLLLCAMSLCLVVEGIDRVAYALDFLSVVAQKQSALMAPATTDIGASSSATRLNEFIADYDEGTVPGNVDYRYVVVDVCNKLCYMEVAGLTLSYENTARMIACHNVEFLKIHEVAAAVSQVLSFLEAVGSLHSDGQSDGQFPATIPRSLQSKWKSASFKRNVNEVCQTLLERSEQGETSSGNAIRACTFLNNQPGAYSGLKLPKRDSYGCTVFGLAVYDYLEILGGMIEPNGQVNLYGFFQTHPEALRATHNGLFVNTCSKLATDKQRKNELAAAKQQLRLAACRKVLPFLPSQQNPTEG